MNHRNASLALAAIELQAQGQPTKALEFLALATADATLEDIVVQMPAALRAARISSAAEDSDNEQAGDEQQIDLGDDSENSGSDQQQPATEEEDELDTPPLDPNRVAEPDIHQFHGATVESGVMVAGVADVNSTDEAPVESTASLSDQLAGVTPDGQVVIETDEDDDGVDDNPFDDVDDVLYTQPLVEEDWRDGLPPTNGMPMETLPMPTTMMMQGQSGGTTTIMQPYELLEEEEHENEAILPTPVTEQMPSPSDPVSGDMPMVEQLEEPCEEDDPLCDEMLIETEAGRQQGEVSNGDMMALVSQPGMATVTSGSERLEEE